jgi:DNA invertase Pin-like site-specific DNA recombinase
VNGKTPESDITGSQPIDCDGGDTFRSDPKVGYARVSTADQNPDLQFDALRRFGVTRIYHETVSGAAKKRPEFNRMMRDLRSGDTIVVWKLDRLGRTTRQVLDTIAHIDRLGAHLVILTQNFDTRTPFGKCLMVMVAAFSELERDLVIERTKAGLAAAKARGRIGGRRVMYTEKQIEEAAKRFREGETLKVIKRDVKSRTGKMIGEAQLGRRIAAFEEKRNAQQS